MTPTTKFAALQPPFRPALESAPRIMRTTLALLLILAVAAVALFGLHALKLLLLGLAGALLAELIVNHLRQESSPGSLSHSAAMGLLLVFTLPATVPWYLALFGAAAAVLIGKHFFGGLGHYLWHPALVGRLILQVLFPSYLAGGSGPVLGRQRLFLGDIFSAAPADWFNFNWFRQHAPAGLDAFTLPQPLDALRHLHTLPGGGGEFQLDQYIVEKLPSLPHIFVGALPGGLGETCLALIILLGLYAIYRGYLSWQLPACFLLAAYLTAALCPVFLNQGQADERLIFPVLSSSVAIGFTWLNLQILSGGLPLAAFIFSLDMTSRPITRKGQALFGLAAGVLAILLRLYTPIAIPTLAALLITQTLTPLIDRACRGHLARGL